MTSFADLRERARDLYRQAEEASGGNLPGTVLPGADPLEASFARRLDELYWTGVERLVGQADARQDGPPIFLPDERLWIDAGVLDPERTWPEAAEGLRREFDAERPARCFYLTEWLRERGIRHAVLREARKRERGKIESLGAEREKLYSGLAALFRDLPGVREDVRELVLSGRLDAHLEALERSALRGDLSGNMAEQRDRLREVRNRILERARARCRVQPEWDAFDRIEEIHRILCRERLAEDAEPAAETSGGGMDSFYGGEIRILRTLMRLGLGDGRVVESCSAYLGGTSWIARREVVAVLGRIRTADPRLPGDPDCMIGSYHGVGFFDWDHDLVFVPLHGTGGARENEVVRAFGTYRLMRDALHTGGQLAAAYREAFAPKDLRAAFLDDYARWVLRVARGEREGIPADRRDFFRKWIGPNPLLLLGPDELYHQSEGGIDRIRHDYETELRSGYRTPEILFRLATARAACHMERNAEQVLDEAIAAAPDNGRYRCAMGYLQQRFGFRDRAHDAFREAIRRAPRTLWSVYAQDALEGGSR